MNSCLEKHRSPGIFEGSFSHDYTSESIAWHAKLLQYSTDIYIYDYDIVACYCWDYN